jgi:hypothetical protein
MCSGKWRGVAAVRAILRNAQRPCGTGGCRRRRGLVPLIDLASIRAQSWCAAAPEPLGFPMMRRSKRFALSLPLAAFHGASFVYVLGGSMAAADAHQSLPAWFTAITIALAFPVVPAIAAVLSVFWTTPPGDLLALVGSEVTVALAWAYFIVWAVCRVLASKPAPPTRPAKPFDPRAAFRAADRQG